jgi:hypothetical protein
MVLYKVVKNNIVRVVTLKKIRKHIIIKQVKRPENMTKTENKFYLIYFIHNLETWVVEKGENNEII